MGKDRHVLPEAKNEKRLEIEMTTPDDFGEAVFLTGNFNNWREGDERYRLDKTGAGQYRYSFAPLPELPEYLEYKYIRGSWEGEELDQYGNAVSNRIVRQDQALVKDQVPRWKKKGLFYKPEFLPEIRVISEGFEIPQLIKTRRIAALLPHDYSHTDRRYPVVYLQDGQNLFDDYAPFGNWALDKKLAVMSETGNGNLIVVAIDHAEKERIREFTPSTQTRLGSGDGKKYVRFLADTLKPFIDRNFRTLPERQHTGIGGSSMGGLISLYAGLMYPEVYSKLLIFSPSLWVAPNLPYHAVGTEESLETKIYIYGGGDEGATMVPNIQNFKHALESSGNMGKTIFNISIDPKGKHNEQRWGEEFPRAIEWLFFED